VTSWLAHYGVLAVLVLMLIDAIFPAASELVMLYGGALASGALTHRVDVLGWHRTGLGAYIAVVVAGVVGYQLGAIGGWWIGKRGGRAFLERHGKWLHLNSHSIDRAERWFERWDSRAVLLGRITPLARSFISIPAGLFKMPFGRYNLMTILGNGVWCVTIAAAGWALGSGYQRFHNDFRYIEYAVAAIAVALIAYLLLRRRHAPFTRPN
jgi:membrane protein DedA with SNARE-associated domain